ncbi:hypothetical protein EBT16_09625 [bacterium]|nr:hypothetical protein [bacterium]
MVKTAVEHQSGPIAFRYPRGEVVGVPLDKQLKSLPIGKGELLQADYEAVDVLLVGVGFAVQTALQAQALLKEKGISTASINARFVKPLDEALLTQWIRRSQLVVTLEENTVCGGFGSAVLEMMQQKNLKQDVLCLGLPDQFIDHATPAIQRKLTGLDAAGVLQKILEKLKSAKHELPLNKPKLDQEVPLVLN